jgi:uncharacterized Zn ribbon protein
MPDESYRCMNEKCKAEFTRQQPGMVNCPKCAGTYVEWTNFYKDWEHDEKDNQWKRKKT